MPYKYRSKIWLEDNGKVFGDGPCELLEKIDKMGSLRKAAKDMKMSYHQAWNLVRMLEKNLGFALLKKQTGGIQGGGSSLTEEGKNLMNSYKQFRNEVNKNLDRLFECYFQGINKP